MAVLLGSPEARGEGLWKLENFYSACGRGSPRRALFEDCIVLLVE